MDPLMAFKDYLEPSFYDYMKFVDQHSCAFLLNDQAFVDAVFQLHEHEVDDAQRYNQFVESLTRKVFGFLDLSPVQLSTIDRAIRDRSMKITDLFNMVSDMGSLPPQPEVTQHVAMGLSGAYPAAEGRTRSPSAKSIILQGGDDSPRPRPGSAPPTMRNIELAQPEQMPTVQQFATSLSRLEFLEQRVQASREEEHATPSPPGMGPNRHGSGAKLCTLWFD